MQEHQRFLKIAFAKFVASTHSLTKGFSSLKINFTKAIILPILSQKNVYFKRFDASNSFSTSRDLFLVINGSDFQPVFRARWSAVSLEFICFAHMTERA